MSEPWEGPYKFGSHHKWTKEQLEGAEEAKLETRRRAVQQCDLLIDANWRFEIPEIVNNAKYETEPWQWYWRAPPKRKGKKGRRFLSTQQAYNFLMRSQGKEPEIFA